MCVGHSHLQLGEYFLNVAVTALCYVHVLFIRSALKDRLRGIGEVLAEGKEISHCFDLHLLALFRPDFTCVLFPSRYHLLKKGESTENQIFVATKKQLQSI